MKKKVLVADIETSLMHTYTFYIGNKVRIAPNQIIKPSKIICISYKWLGEKGVKHLIYDMKKRCHRQLLKDFIKVAKEADEVMAYNGDNFDIKWIAGAAALEGLGEKWDWNNTIDPFKQYKKSFRWPSLKLDYVASSLGLGHKNPMSLQDWIDIENGCEKALKKMVTYCDKDVVLLEKVYNRLNKYTKKTQSEIYREKALHSKRPTSCPACSDGKGDWIRFGTYKGLQKWHCKNCGTNIKTRR